MCYLSTVTCCPIFCEIVEKQEKQVVVENYLRWLFSSLTSFHCLFSFVTFTFFAFTFAFTFTENRSFGKPPAFVLSLSLFCIKFCLYFHFFTFTENRSCWKLPSLVVRLIFIIRLLWQVGFFTFAFVLSLSFFCIHFCIHFLVLVENRSCWKLPSLVVRLIFIIRLLWQVGSYFSGSLRPDWSRLSHFSTRPISTATNPQPVTGDCGLFAFFCILVLCQFGSQLLKTEYFLSVRYISWHPPRQCWLRVNNMYTRSSRKAVGRVKMPLTLMATTVLTQNLSLDVGLQ